MSFPESPPLEPTPVAPTSPPGWYPDPWWEARARWWDGNNWSRFLANPAPERWLGGPPPTLGIAAAGWMVGAVLALMVLIELTAAPIADLIGSATAVGYSYVILFGGMFVTAAWTSRRYGTGDLRQDLGLKFRPPDVLLFFGGILLWMLQVVLVLLIQAGDVPMRSNGEVISQIRDRPGIFAVIAVAAVVGAPIFEEICFRGVIQRSLASRMHPAWAVAATSLIFGLYHFTPGFGSGNIGMVLVLTAIGAVLGTLAQITGRLAPSMFAHAGMNALVMILIWFTAPEFV